MMKLTRLRDSVQPLPVVDTGTAPTQVTTPKVRPEEQRLVDRKREEDPSLKHFTERKVAAEGVKSGPLAQTTLADWDAARGGNLAELRHPTISFADGSTLTGRGLANFIGATGLSAEQIAANPMLSRFLLDLANSHGWQGVLSAKQAEPLLARFGLATRSGSTHRSNALSVSIGSCSDVRALHASWPQQVDKNGKLDLLEFGARASELDRRKQSLLEGVLARNGQSTANAIAAVEEMHGKAGQTTALVEKMVPHYFRDREFTHALAALTGIGDVGVISLREEIERAAPYLTLGELYAPTFVYAQHARVTQEDAEAFIKTRPQASATLAEKVGLVSGEDAKTIAALRYTGEARSLAAQMLDLLEQATALTQKRFFRTEDGSLDRQRISETLTNNLRGTDLSPELVALVVDHLPAK